MQAEVDVELFEAVEKERKKLKLKKRQVVEWGLKAFVAAATNQRSG